MLRTTRITGDTLRGRATLQSEIREVVSPFYVDPSAVLDREFAKCTDCYLALKGGNSVHAFFLVQWDVDVQRVYLGLSCTRLSSRKSGIVQQLYAMFINEAQVWEESSGVRLLLWGTTATPAVLRGVHTMFAHAVPDTEGRFSASDEKLALSLRASVGGSSLPGDHPFVARAAAPATRYASVESDHNRRYAQEHGITLLDRLGVREENGDRLIFLCRVPQRFSER